MDRRAHRRAPNRRGRPRSSGNPPRRRRTLPPWLTLLGSLTALVLAFAFIFFVARGCIATQEATQLRKYATSSDSILSESASLGNGELQRALEKAASNPTRLDEQALGRAASESNELYQRALDNEEVPPEFERADHYLVSALGMRASALERLEGAARGSARDFERTLPAAMADLRLSDAVVSDHFLPASREALAAAGQSGGDAYLYEPRPFMDYGAVGFGGASSASFSRSNPNALHGVQIAGVQVAGEALYPGGNVTLTGSDEPDFSVAVANGGEVSERGVPVEVVVETRAERQSRSVTIEQMEPNSSATVEIQGFRPGELNESAGVSVTAGPVEYEESTQNNTLEGTVTFGL